MTLNANFDVAQEELVIIRVYIVVLFVYTRVVYIVVLFVYTRVVLYVHVYTCTCIYTCDAYVYKIAANKHVYTTRVYKLDSKKTWWRDKERKQG